MRQVNVRGAVRRMELLSVGVGAAASASSGDGYETHTCVSGTTFPTF